MATQVVMPKLSPTMEAQALATGVLRKILVPAGETVPLGAIIAIIGEPDEDISALVSQAQASSGGAHGVKKEPAEDKVEGQPAKSDAPADYQPGMWMEESAASGKSAPSKEAAPAQSKDGAGGNGQRGQGGRLIVSPIAARMAAEAGINLHTLTGSGPGGRIVKRDIEAAMSGDAASAQPPEEQAQPATQLRAVPTPAQQPSVQPEGGAAPFHEENLTTMRATIARRLVASLGPIPHIFLTTEIEMDRAAEMRRQLNELDPEH
ncbi:MAG: hypothetical protein QOE95_2503, partial [Gaiellaceae bacterium]|nr:hypothetical protein [Gaiellaceae bacterium]